MLYCIKLELAMELFGDLEVHRREGRRFRPVQIGERDDGKWRNAFQRFLWRWYFGHGLRSLSFVESSDEVDDVLC